MRHKTHERFSRRWQRCSGLTFRARYRSQSCITTNCHERRCKKKRNVRDPEEALPLQMLDCSRDRFEKNFETHRGKVDQSCSVRHGLGRQERPALHMTTTNVGAHWSRGFSPFCTQSEAIFCGASRVGRRQVEASTTTPKVN